jgi:hypothetical protein
MVPPMVDLRRTTRARGLWQGLAGQCPGSASPGPASARHSLAISGGSGRFRWCFSHRGVDGSSGYQGLGQGFRKAGKVGEFDSTMVQTESEGTHPTDGCFMGPPLMKTKI